MTGSLLERASILVELHRTDEALALVGQALAQDPQNVRGHLLAARANLDAERWHDAEAAAHRALGLDPENADALLLIGCACAGLGATIEAEKWVCDCVRAAPDSSTAVGLLAELQALNNDDEAAIVNAERALGLAPDSHDAHFSFGRVMQITGRHAAAEQALRRALGLAPDHAATLAALAETLAARGRASDAAELLRLAARADGRDESIHQAILRYTRGAAWGMATVPVIVLVALISVSAGNIVTSLVFAALVPALIIARLRRLRRFPRAARRLLNRRAIDWQSFEIRAARGPQPWWWRLPGRVPAVWWALLSWALLLRLVTDPSEPIGDALLQIGAVAVVTYWLTWRWYRTARLARQTHPLYDTTSP